MTRRAPTVFALLVLLLLFSRPATASASGSPERQAFVFLVNGVTFEQLMAVPEMRALARTGGAALLSPRTVPGDDGPGAYLTLGTGVRSSVPDPEVTVDVSQAGLELHDVEGVVEANSDRSTPGLLGQILESRKLDACVFGGGSHTPAILVAMDRSGVALGNTAVSLLAQFGHSLCNFSVFDLTGVSTTAVGPFIREQVRLPPAERVLAVVLEARPTVAMDRVKDELTPIVVAEGPPGELFTEPGSMHTLTSDTTRRDGVVSNEDVAPTILSFFGIATPSDMNGARIRTVDDTPPFDLHERHLAQREMTVPVQAAAGTAVTVFGLIGIFLISVRPRVPRVISRRAGMLTTVVPPLGAALLAAGGLPTISYAWVVPFLVGVPLVVGAAAIRLRSRGTLVPAAALGTAALAYLLVEAMQGWPDTPTTLFGGTALDGARFYGLPNVDIGLVLAAALWVAAILEPIEGWGVLVAAGLFAGFPHLGANLGGALTMFVAASLWIPIRLRWGLSWRSVLFMVGVVAAGMAVVLASQVVWSTQPTHGTRFVEHAPGEGLSGLLDTFRSRLLVGWRILVENPFGWVPVLGLLVELVVVLRPRGLVAEAFTRYPEWRDAVLVTVVASMVAYVVNDSGVAAAGLGFGLAAAGILYVPLMEETWTKVRP